MIQDQPMLAEILKTAPGILLGDYRLTSLAPGVDAITGFFPPTFLAIQTRRQGGVSQGPFASLNLGDHVGDDPRRVAENRAYVTRCLPGEPFWLQQVHGCDVAMVGADRSQAATPALGWLAVATNGSPSGVAGEARQSKADASLTADPKQVCAIMTADCLPILVARPATGQCAAIHAGWRGLLNGVIEALLNRMLEARQGGGPLYLWLGPAIGEGAFEVGDEVRQAFLARSAQSGLGFAAAKKGDGKWFASLAGLAIQRIAAWSDAAKWPETSVHVAVSADCTFRDSKNYFSYRRDGVTGRMVSAICRI